MLNVLFHVFLTKRIGFGLFSAFPEDRFSIMDPIGEILDNAEALALLETELPAIAHDERSRKYRSMGLIRIINRMPHKPDEDFLKDLNRKLNTIPKKTEGRK